MWDRKTIKSRGKYAFKANYWKSVLVALILTIVSGTGAVSYNANSAATNQDTYAQNITDMVAQNHGLLAFVIIVCIAVIVAGVALGALVFNPLVYGCRSFFYRNSMDPNTEVGVVGSGFKKNYKNIVITMFMTDIKILLWSLLFIIPGVIKSLEYRLVTYILVDNPEMDYKEAQELSRKLMDGNKWDSFVLDLSFIGWMIVAGLTAGIAGIFFVSPYIDATDAELYRAIRYPETAADRYAKNDNGQAPKDDIVIIESEK